MKSEDTLKTHLPTQEEFLKARTHYGHLVKRRHPNMEPYIFMQSDNIHVIDLNATAESLEKAGHAIKNIAKRNKKIWLVSTKQQARSCIERVGRELELPYVTERWLGGMLTNFRTVRKSLNKLGNIDNQSGKKWNKFLAKKERLMISREKDKLKKIFAGIGNEVLLPSALLIVDIKTCAIAVSEARKLNIPIFAIVDTNSDPELVDYPIFANDDSHTSIQLIINYLASAIKEGMQEAKQNNQTQKKGKGEYKHTHTRKLEPNEEGIVQN